jgi:hypothetical protein
MTWSKLIAQLVLRALVSPPLALALLRTGWRFRRRGWFKKFPFLPVPSRDYIRWRMLTAYGDYDAVPPLEDIVRYARWAVRNP